MFKKHFERSAFLFNDACKICSGLRLYQVEKCDIYFVGIGPRNSVMILVLISVEGSRVWVF